MPAQRPRASFEPISPDFNLKALVEVTPNFDYVQRISCDMIDEQGLAAFEKLVTLHVIIGGKPLVIDGFEDRLDPWTFSPKWLRDNVGDKVEQARDLGKKENVPLTMGHYLRNMGLLARQYFDKPGNYREKNRQRVYLKDIDCPPVWHDKLREHVPSTLFYLNDSTGEVGGPGAIPDPSGRRPGKGIARAGDLMSSLPSEMRAENMMCYIGHEGTYTPAHREMCASLGHNIMVEASSTVSEDGKPEQPGSSIWFMTESKDRHTVSEYWLSVLGHDIETENHFAQIVAWKKAPFNVYVVEQRPGDFILIPPLAPHQVWNRGTRTMKAAWNRTTVETLELALSEALPKARVVCRDEQYKNKAIIYYTLQKYGSLLTLAHQQASRMAPEQGQRLLYTGKVKQLLKDFKRLFALYKTIILSEMFNPDNREGAKNLEYLPFDSNVTCAYCRGNIFNRFLTCPTPACKELLGHNEDDPYDVCMDCYAMGRSCGCISNLKWCEQFRWKELSQKYDSWRNLIITLDGGVNDKTPMGLLEERKRLGKKTLAEICREQLKRRPWKDITAPGVEKEDDDEDEEIEVNDDGSVKKIVKKKSKSWLKNHSRCHVCQKRHENWKMAFCTTCDQGWCYGSLYRGWDKMPLEIMENPRWSCPHCLGICFAGNCRRDSRQDPYEPKGTLLGHDTRRVADARSIEALVDFSVSNLNWLKDDDAVARTESTRIKRAALEAARAKQLDPQLQAELEEDQAEAGVEDSRVEFEYSPEGDAQIDPALSGSSSRPCYRRGENGMVDPSLTQEDETAVLQTLERHNSSLPPPGAMLQGAAPDGYAPVQAAGYVAPTAQMYPQPGADAPYRYADPYQPLEEVSPMDEDYQPSGRKDKKRARSSDGDEDINMQAPPRNKRARFSDVPLSSAMSRPKNEATKQFEKEKERKALEKAKAEGRFIAFQAALKGRKRLVRLNIPGARLAQLLAQQAAKHALAAGEEVDAPHEVENGNESEEENITLLRSDVVPKNDKQRNKQYYQQRKSDGFTISGQGKKALIPVEKDEDYRTGRSETNTRSEPRAKTRTRHSGVEFEEVDIGSDDEDGDDVEPVTEHPNREGPRKVPTYLQERHADDADLPDQLPDNYKEKRPGGKERVRPGPKKGALTAQPAVVTKKGAFGRPAGKKPSMRPAAPAGVNLDGANEEENEEFVDVDDIVPSAGIGTTRGVTNGVSKAPAGSTWPSGSTQPSPANGRSRGSAEVSPVVRKPGAEKRGLGASPDLQALPAVNGPRPGKRSKGSKIHQPSPGHSTAEKNRLAKLHALQGIDDNDGGVSDEDSDSNLSPPPPSKAALAANIHRSIFDRGKKIRIRGAKVTSGAPPKLQKSSRGVAFGGSHVDADEDASDESDGVDVIPAQKIPNGMTCLARSR